MSFRYIIGKLTTKLFGLDGVTQRQLAVDSDGHLQIDIAAFPGGSILTASMFTAKGSLLSASAAGVAAELTVGANGTILRADSTQTTGLEWATIQGTAGQITLTHNATDITLSLPADVLIPTILTVPNTGLHLLDTNASHDLIIKPGSDLTADKTLTLTTGDADRSFSFDGSGTGKILRADGTNFVASTLTMPDTAAIGSILYASAADVISALAAGALTEILVGGGAAAPVWTTATGSGAPVRATAPTLVNPILGSASATDLGIGVDPALYPLHVVDTITSTAADQTSLISTSITGNDSGNVTHTGVGFSLTSAFVGSQVAGHRQTIRGLNIALDTSGSGQFYTQTALNVTGLHTANTAFTTQTGARITAQNAGSGSGGTGVGLSGYYLNNGGGTVDLVYGTYYGVIQAVSGVITDARAMETYITNTGGTITTGYLLKGAYTGTVGTKWGLHFEGETKNYLSGRLEIGGHWEDYEYDFGLPISFYLYREDEISTDIARLATFALHDVLFTETVSMSVPGHQFTTAIRVAATKTATGSATLYPGVTGLFARASRNAVHDDYADNGTLEDLSGLTVFYGHDQANPAATPVTTTAYGIFVFPEFHVGTIGTAYDLYLASVSGTGTVSGTHYGIYQAMAGLSNYLAGSLSVAGGDLVVGVNDTAYGKISAYGQATGSDEGGELLLYLAADHDTAISYFRIQAEQDDLLFGPDTDADALKLDSNLDLYLTAGSFLIKAAEYINFGATQGATGYGIRDNSNVIEYKDSGGAWRAIRHLDVTPDADLQSDGITFTGTAGENLIHGETCYYKSDGKWWKSDADAAATMPVEAMALATIAAEAAGLFIKVGVVRKDAWDWTVGSRLYGDTTTAGGMTHTPPAGNLDIVQDLGFALSADVIFFNPNAAIVEVTA